MLRGLAGGGRSLRVGHIMLGTCDNRLTTDTSPTTTNHCQILLEISGKQKTPLALFTKNSAQIPTISILSYSRAPEELLGTEMNDKRK